MYMEESTLNNSALKELIPVTELLQCTLQKKEESFKHHSSLLPNP